MNTNFREELEYLKKKGWRESFNDHVVRDAEHGKTYSTPIMTAYTHEKNMEEFIKTLTKKTTFT